MKRAREVGAWRRGGEGGDGIWGMWTQASRWIEGAEKKAARYGEKCGRQKRWREWGGGWMSEREGGKQMKHCGRDGERRGRDAAFLVMAQTATAGADRGMEGIDEKGRN